MKNLLLLFAIFISVLSSAQVSTTRINDIRLGMSQSELEKVLGKKIKIPVNTDGYPEDEYTVTHNAVTYSLYFWMLDEGLKISSISSNDASLKTLSGIKKGSTLDELWSKYKNYNLRIYNHWDENGLSKDERSFEIMDYDNGSSLGIHLKNNKVTGFSVGYNEGC